MDEQSKAILLLEELLKLPGNEICADCRAKGPKWASVNLGVFICIRCAGIHRSLGVHISKVKSCTLDRWTLEQVEFMQQMGNERAMETFECEVPASYPRPIAQSSYSNSVIEQWIISKYKHRTFVKGNKLESYKLHMKNGTLSDELWLHVFQYLNEKDLLHICAVNKHFSRLAVSCWKQLYVSKWHTSYWDGDQEKINWKKLHFSKTKLVDAISETAKRKSKFQDIKSDITCEILVVGDMSIFDALRKSGTKTLVTDSDVGANSSTSLSASSTPYRRLSVRDSSQTASTFVVETHGIRLALSLLALSSERPSNSSLIYPVLWFVYACDGKTSLQLERSVSNWTSGIQSSASILIATTSHASSEKVLVDLPSLSACAKENNISFCTVAKIAMSEDEANYILHVTAEVIIERMALVGWPGLTIPPRWIPDDCSLQCMMCNKQFTVFVRRHHCRSCGALICNECSSHSTTLKQLYNTSERMRVCKHCYDVYKQDP